MPIARTQAPSMVLLELDGKVVCSLRTVEGGEAFGVVAHAQTGPPGKHVAEWRYAPIEMTIGIDAGSGVFLWINEWLAGKAEPRSGAVVIGDFERKNGQRLEFFDALITSVDFGTFDASSKDALHIALTIQPARTKRATAPLPALDKTMKKAKKASRCNYRLSLGDLPTARAALVTVPIAASTVDPSVASTAPRQALRDAIPTVSNLVVTMSAADQEAYISLVDSTMAGGAVQQPQTGSFEILGPDLKTVLLTITLNGLGIVRAAPERYETNSERIARGRAEFYCETLAISEP